MSAMQGFNGIPERTCHACGDPRSCSKWRMLVHVAIEAKLQREAVPAERQSECSCKTQPNRLVYALSTGFCGWYDKIRAISDAATFRVARNVPEKRKPWITVSRARFRI
jgi:hypothetical protein